MTHAQTSPDVLRIRLPTVHAAQLGCGVILQRICQEALCSARQQGQTVVVRLESGAVLRVAASPDRIALYRPDQAPDQEEAHRITAALGWPDPVIEPLQGRTPGWLITPRTAVPPPPFRPGLPFPGRQQMRPHTLYHLTHGQTDYSLLLREDGQEVHWRELVGPHWGESWISFQQHQQGGAAQLARTRAGELRLQALDGRTALNSMQKEP